MTNDEPTARAATRLNGSSAGARRGTPGADQRRDAAEGTETPGFDDALSQLEETVAALEGGQLNLEEALVLFERGMHLAQICQQALDRAELRVRQLVVAENDAGDLTVDTLDLEVE